MTVDTYDTIIGGGGIAGLSAALWLGRYRRRVLLLSSGQPRNAISHALHGFPGFDNAPPGKLLDLLRHEVMSYGAELSDAWVDTISKNENSSFLLRSGKSTYITKKILIASGVVDKKPELPRMDEFDGRSIWHCPACDGYEYSGKKIIVYGWGKHIAGYAEQFRLYSTDIVIVTDGRPIEVSSREKLRLNRKGIELFSESIVRLEGEQGVLRSILLRDGRILPCDAIFYSLRHQPRLELLQQLGCGMRSDGSVKVNRKQETTIRGVYVAGDITPLEELAVVAAATGTIAASNIHKSLQRSDE